MAKISNQDLIEKAASIVKPKRVKDSLFADVGCALLTDTGDVFVGVCASSGSNTFCAETIAIGSMISSGQYHIKKIVAVWKDDKGKVFVIAPCGNCRQLMYEVDSSNLDTEVILDQKKKVKLKTLLPYFDWWKKQ